MGQLGQIRTRRFPSTVAVDARERLGLFTPSYGAAPTTGIASGSMDGSPVLNESIGVSARQDCFLLPVEMGSSTGIRPDLTQVSCPVVVSLGCLLLFSVFPPFPLCSKPCLPPWQVKNSWGAEWGAEGYILLKREADQEGGECGILEQASYPVLA